MKLSNNNTPPRDFEDKRADKPKKRKPLSRYATLRRRRRRRGRVLRFLGKVLMWSLFAMLYYAAYSILFDTHFEQVAQSNVNQLESEYNTLMGRYDSLEIVLDNLSKRDSAIFRTVFESPMNKESATAARERRIDHIETLLALPSSSISAELKSRTSSLKEQFNVLESIYKEMILKIDSVGEASRNIPSIQPIANSSLTKLTASYGLCLHPFYRTIKMHEGVDYTTPEGTRVFATADGVVEQVSQLNSTSGKTVTINHGNGYKSSYKHLSSISVRRNQKVKRGDIIALTGNSGLSLSPHLHYEIEFNGESVDPLNYFFLELSPDEYHAIKKIAQSRKQSFD